MKFTAERIKEHTSLENHSRPDFLTRFIKAREKFPELMTDGRLATYTNTNVSAGSDTTAIALREVTWRILTHPKCYEKVMDEIKNTIMSRAIAEEDCEHPVTWAESQRMAYFQLVEFLYKKAIFFYVSSGAGSCFRSHKKRIPSYVGPGS